jgi:hypothetical protein
MNLTNQCTCSHCQTFLDDLKSLVLSHLRPANEIILDEKAMQDYLSISPRTAAQLRSEGMITYYKQGGRIYYKLSDILACIEVNKVESFSTKRRIA